MSTTMVQEKLLLPLMASILLIHLFRKHLFQSYLNILDVFLEQVTTDKVLLESQDTQIKKQIGDMLSFTMSIQEIQELWLKIFNLEVKVFQ